MNDQPERISAAELRQRLDKIDQQLETIEDAVAAMRNGLAVAASHPASPAGTQTVMTAEAIKLDYVDGKRQFKLLGAPYTKFGVRVWPEVIESLGIDANALTPGTNPIAPIAVRVLLVETADPETGELKTSAKKVIGRA